MAVWGAAALRQGVPHPRHQGPPTEACVMARLQALKHRQQILKALKRRLQKTAVKSDCRLWVYINMKCDSKTRHGSLERTVFVLAQYALSEVITPEELIRKNVQARTSLEIQLLLKGNRPPLRLLRLAARRAPADS
ncbi:hypothetical protein O3P69_003360 [Scylla paramamosain]|uniref:Uncharacterized protein n=1 Tax=Scylla paramamosain TaxID=85552 RepID=A0AAW0UGH3_SCYPA